MNQPLKLSTIVSKPCPQLRSKSDIPNLRDSMTYCKVVVGLLNKTIEVYDRATMLKVRTLVGHDDHVWSIDMNKEYIVSGSWDSRSAQ